MSNIQSPSDFQETASDTATIRRPAEAPATAASILKRAAALRDEVELTHNDARDLHHDSVELALDERTTVVGLQEPAQLLESFGADWGTSWTALSRLLGVTPTAIRKWRKGEQITPQNRRRLARAYAVLEMLSSIFPVGDVASWLEMPISDEAVVTPVDLYAANRLDLLFDLAGRRTTGRGALDRFADDWRDRYGVDDRFAVVEAPDGHRSIIEREGQS
jgi:hypothetical protein